MIHTEVHCPASLVVRFFMCQGRGAPRLRVLGMYGIVESAKWQNLGLNVANLAERRKSTCHGSCHQVCLYVHSQLPSQAAKTPSLVWIISSRLMNYITFVAKLQ